MPGSFLGVQQPVTPTPGDQLCDNQSGAAAQIVGTLTPGTGRTAYLSGFTISGLGATGATGIIVVIAGILGGPISMTVPILAGATTGLVPFIREFPTPLAGSAPGQAITVTVPSFGSGNTSARIETHGFQI